MLARLRGFDLDARWRLIGGAVAVAAAVPLVTSGPGNDLDVANVFRSGRSIARHLSYAPSRPPGAPVHEAIVGAFDLLGGPLLTNLASLLAAGALLAGLDRLLRRESVGRGGRWAVALVAANPWFVIAATSTADYVFALAFVVGAALALRDGRPVLAGLLAAAAMGCRIGSGALVLALLIAEITGRRETGGRPEGSGAGRRAVVAGIAAAAATVVVFVPSALAAGGLSFADNDFSTASPVVQLGRAFAKDVTLLGPVATVVALLAVPAVWTALRRWPTSWLVRFSVVGLVLSQALFIRFPWKMAHLLPGLLCVAVLLAVALDDRRRLLIALVVLQALFCLVRLDLVAPDDPNAATGGRVRPGVGWGPPIIDWQCRREHPNAYRGRQKVEVEAAWDCAKPFGR
ncbi:MAG: hypothetical protein ACR2LA_00630 [Acidimicrobiales bacterium]